MQARRVGRPIAGLGYGVIALLMVSAALAAARAIAFAGERSLVLDALAGRPVSLDEALASDRRLNALLVWSFIVLLLTAVVWCVWQYRAHRNLKDMGRLGLVYTPGWAVGWWFVPVASFWKPLGTVTELWEASAPIAEPRAWWKIRMWWVLVIWWLTWIGSRIVGIVSVGMRNSDEPDAIVAGDLVAVVAHLLEVGAAIFAIVIVSSVLSRQRRLEGVLASATPPPIPTPGGVPVQALPPPPPSS